MHFAKEILETAEFLKELGYEPSFAPDTHDCVKDPSLNENEEYCFNADIMRVCMDAQENCDAILVLNHPKHRSEGSSNT